MSSEFTRKVFAAVDASDATTFAGFFGPAARLRFGNNEPLLGRDAIEQGIGQFFTTIAGLKHEIVNEWEAGGTYIAETDVTYRRHDGGEVTVPAISIIDTDGDSISDYRIFVDLTPVYA